MCLIAAAVSKDFGVLAADSASYVADKAIHGFETPKLSLWQGKYLVSFLGTNLYFSRMDRSKFLLPLDGLSLYLQDFLKSSRPDVEAVMKEFIEDEDEQKPHFCLYVLGKHGKYPTLAQFNSFADFKPKYLWSNNGLKFSTVLYGDDSKPEKQEIFKQASDYMDAKAENFKNEGVDLSPGVVAEVLARGIHHKADLEMKIGTKKKYAGGVVNAGVVEATGKIYSLSGLEVV